MKYKKSLSFKEKVLYVLSFLKKASAEDVSAEIIELDGLSAEEEVMEMTIETKEQLNKLYEDGEVTRSGECFIYSIKR